MTVAVAQAKSHAAPIVRLLYACLLELSLSLDTADTESGCIRRAWACGAPQVWRPAVVRRFATSSPVSVSQCHVQ
jgi:hypothetical protein